MQGQQLPQYLFIAQIRLPTIRGKDGFIELVGEIEPGRMLVMYTHFSVTLFLTRELALRLYLLLYSKQHGQLGWGYVSLLRLLKPCARLEVSLFHHTFLSQQVHPVRIAASSWQKNEERV
jgi:hypothetical protein